MQLILSNYDHQYLIITLAVHKQSSMITQRYTLVLNLLLHILSSHNSFVFESRNWFIFKSMIIYWLFKNRAMFNQLLIYYRENAICNPTLNSTCKPKFGGLRKSCNLFSCYLERIAILIKDIAIRLYFYFNPSPQDCMKPILIIYSSLHPYRLRILRLKMSKKKTMILKKNRMTRRMTRR